MKIKLNGRRGEPCVVARSYLMIEIRLKVKKFYSRHKICILSVAPGEHTGIAPTRQIYLNGVQTKLTNGATKGLAKKEIPKSVEKLLLQSLNPINTPELVG